ncbi:serine/threonine-protein kinase [Terrabacter sp. 2RAF25]|uniref:serine/threonine-protein kinase n=1 Tax=Terrabacter sp. 2RAF25 TaxID=3232998 RepID=UPI003F9861CD
MTEQPDLVIAGRYRLLERIGAGGMGHVWRARDERLGRTVAVKLLHSPVGLPDAEADMARQRAMREARITARLQHPNAVPVFDVVDHDGRPCLVMQYLPSRSLQDVLAEAGTLPVDEVARLGSEVAAGLAAAHDAGIVHRDVKPGNILVGDDGTARITDFGISHALGDASLTSTGLVTGTPAYLAPEVARGAASTSASDVFSLGSTLFAALEGAPPFGQADNAMALLHRVATGNVTEPRASAVSPLLVRMLDPDPSRRPSMDEVARSLTALAAGRTVAFEAASGHTKVLPAAPPAPSRPPAAATRPEPVAAPRVAASPSGQPPGRQRPEPAPAGPSGESHSRTWLLTALIALLLVAGGIAFVLSRNGSTPSGTAAPPSSSSVASSKPSPSTSRASSPPTSSAAAPTTPAPRPTTPAPRPTTTSTSTTQAPPPVTAQDLERAVRDYYALLPGDRDAGWARLSARYQQTTAKNRETYEAFWTSVDKVSTHQVRGSSPDSVTATVRYDFGDGRRVEEVTSYTLVRQGDALLIDSSTVRSSRPA